jgi:membrane protease subunit (stomatin/prohibitin family)
LATRWSNSFNFALSSYATPQATVDISLLKSEAMSIVKKFGATLKPQLKSALKSGGAVNAVSVCAVVAPQVAKQNPIFAQLVISLNLVLAGLRLGLKKSPSG